MTVIPASCLSRAELQILGNNLPAIVQRDRQRPLDDFDAIFALDLAGPLPASESESSPTPKRKEANGRLRKKSPVLVNTKARGRSLSGLLS